jgi:hypothetical protein
MDWFLKYIHFILYIKKLIVEELAELYIRYLIKKGVLKNFILDWGRQFIIKFIKTLYKIVNVVGW